jgi:hypothetical protein
LVFLKSVALMKRVLGSFENGRLSLQTLSGVLLLCLIVVAVLVVLNETSSKDEHIGAMMVERVERTEVEIKRLFSTMTKVLGLLTGWGRNGELDVSAPERLTLKLTPLCQWLENISSIQVLAFEGPTYRLSGAVDACDLQVVDDSPPLPRPVQFYKDRFGDPGTPGFALTDVYPLPGQNTLGISGLSSWPGADSREHIAVVSISLADLSDTLAKLPAGENGEVLWLSRSGDVRQLRKLAEAETRNLPPPDETLRAVVEAVGDPAFTGEPFRFQKGEEAWWCAVYTIVQVGERARIALALPESELLPRFGSRGRTLLALLLLLTVGLGVVVYLWIRSDRTGSSVRQYSEADEAELRALIDSGESIRLEFKSTLRWNLQKDRPGKEVEFTWLKTVVAFLNSGGGTLLVGVSDLGEVTGIEQDRFASEDKFLLHFNNLIKEHIGLELASLVGFTIRGLDGKRLLIVDCNRSSEPVFLRKGNAEEFYIRVGPGSRKLSPSQVLDYVKSR